MISDLGLRISDLRNSVGFIKTETSETYSCKSCSGLHLFNPGNPKSDIPNPKLKKS